MIQVTIAGRLTADDVEGVRWVLVDDDEPGPQALSLPDAAAAALPDSGPEARRRLWLAATKALVLLVAFAAAMWTAQSQFGRPRVGWLQPAAAAASAVPAAASW